MNVNCNWCERKRAGLEDPRIKVDDGCIMSHCLIVYCIRVSKSAAYAARLEACACANLPPLASWCLMIYLRRQQGIVVI